MRRYAITLRHGSGKITIHTTGSRLAVAVCKVLDFERAPFGAITNIKKGEWI
jgi:hypothetical protein